MPSYVTRKKLHPTTISDLNFGLYGVWSHLKSALDNKKIKDVRYGRFRKGLLHYAMDELIRLAMKCEIRLPERKVKDEKNNTRSRKV